MTKITTIKGIGKTFEKDFARINLSEIEDFKGKSEEDIFKQLCFANDAENHATSKNYLYVIRMIIYVAEGGIDPAKIKWSVWKD